MSDTHTRVDRHQLFAPAVLAVSVAVLLGATMSSQPYLVDFRVYMLGGAALSHPETLYSFAYSAQSPDQPLPFVYPPFAAIVFWPLTVLPVEVAGLLWQLAMVAAVYAIVWISQRMVGVGTHRSAMLWTAGVIWLEPLRIALTLGQVGVFLTLAVLYAARALPRCAGPWEPDVLARDAEILVAAVPLEAASGRTAVAALAAAGAAAGPDRCPIRVRSSRPR